MFVRCCCSRGAQSLPPIVCQHICGDSVLAQGQGLDLGEKHKCCIHVLQPTDVG